MKTTLRMIFSLICVGLVLATLIAPALAQDGDGESPWGEFLNPDGSINWSSLTYLGETSEEQDWTSNSCGRRY